MRRASPLPLALLLLTGMLMVVAPACGKRGPPLPPLRPAPDRVADLVAVRRADSVALRFAVPARNADGSTPLIFDRAEVYALTVAAGRVRPTVAEIVTVAHRIAELRAVPPAQAAGAPPPKPGEGIAGQTLVFAEPVAVVTDPAPAAAGRGGGAPAAGVLAATTRFYVVVPFANRTRPGAASEVVAVPLGPVPAPVSNVTLTWDERTLTATWVEGASGQSFHTYVAPAPVAATVLPSAAPLTKAEFTQPVVFGTQVCLTVRAARVAAPVTFESTPSPSVCRTPVDTFPPPAPTGLVAFASAGSISLTWDAVSAADLAGYLVLRGEGTGDTLSPITASPLTTASFTDTTARAGVRYTYAVVAVDRATPPNRSQTSNRVTETGR